MSKINNIDTGDENWQEWSRFHDSIMFFHPFLTRSFIIWWWLPKTIFACLIPKTDWMNEWWTDSNPIVTQYGPEAFFSASLFSWPWWWWWWWSSPIGFNPSFQIRFCDSKLYILGICCPYQFFVFFLEMDAVVVGRFFFCWTDLII